MSVVARLVLPRKLPAGEQKLSGCKDRCSARIAPDWLMVSVHRGAAWKITVYDREHGVPHFHIE